MDKAKNILVVDDSEDDFFLLENAFRRAATPHRLFHILDGDLVLVLKPSITVTFANRLPGSKTCAAICLALSYFVTFTTK